MNLLKTKCVDKTLNNDDPDTWFWYTLYTLFFGIYCTYLQCVYTKMYWPKLHSKKEALKKNVILNITPFT